MSLAPRRSGLGGLPVTAVATATALVVVVSLASTAFAFHGPPAIRRSARCCTFHSSTDESAVVLASSKDGDGGTFYDDFADFGNGDDDDGRSEDWKIESTVTLERNETDMTSHDVVTSCDQ